MVRVWSPLALLALIGACAGCSTLAFYGQAIGGQWQVLRARRPITQIQNDPATSPSLRETLRIATSARSFASRELGLPANASYTTYADLAREYVVWNVFAAPPLSFELRQSCFLIAGCVSYRGFFSESAATAYAASLRAQGDDVFVGGIAAYSTLGWFDDPVLNTMLRWSTPELVKTLFHELAHQLIYITDDSGFNESFATTVADYGYARWQAADPIGRATAAEPSHERELIALLQATRAKLQRVYASADSAAEKLKLKATRFAELSHDYTVLKAHWHGDTRYDQWINTDLNNAKLASVATYYDLVPGFTALLAQHGAHLNGFYAAVRALARLDATTREACLRAHAEHRHAPEVCGDAPLTAANR